MMETASVRNAVGVYSQPDCLQWILYGTALSMSSKLPPIMSRSCGPLWENGGWINCLHQHSSIDFLHYVCKPLSQIESQQLKSANTEIRLMLIVVPQRLSVHNHYILHTSILCCTSDGKSNSDFLPLQLIHHSENFILSF